MGITNLLQFIKDAGSTIKISDLEKSTVAVDAYCWLHKGIFSCADKLARGEDSDMYVKYCMKYVDMLLAWKIKVIMVFDGRHLPAKEATEQDRRKKRDNHKMKAAELLILDRGNEAQCHLRQSIDVTHKMALEVIKACRSKHVDCIVAPFEADAQMAYLNIAGYADYVITEDSDLLVFGAKKIIYKLDLTGNCCLVDRKKLPVALKVREQQYSDAKFRYMCILSGSDYWPGIKGMGLKKAKDYVFSIEDPNFENALRKVRSYVKGIDVEISPQMLSSFRCTNLMFQYQPVYDPIKRQVVPLNSLDPGTEDQVFSMLSLKDLELPTEQAFQLALGNLDPFSLKDMDQWSPQELGDELPKTSIWSRNYEKSSSEHVPSKEKTPTPIANRVLQNFRRMTSIHHKQPENCLKLSNDDSLPAINHSVLKPVNSSTCKDKGTSIKSSENELMADKRKLEETNDIDFLQQQYSQSVVCSDTSMESPPDKSSKSEYHFGDTDSASLKSLITIAKKPRFHNPFLKTPGAAGSKSPDLSDGSLKSGLTQILNEKSQKKVVQKVLSPYFLRIYQPKALA